MPLDMNGNLKEGWRLIVDIPGDENPTIEGPVAEDFINTWWPSLQAAINAAHETDAAGTYILRDQYVARGGDIWIHLIDEG